MADKDFNSAIVTVLEQESETMQAYIDSLTPEKRARIAGTLRHVKTGLYAVAPIICNGPEKCPFIKHCPIPEIGLSGKVDFGPRSDYPIARACIMESTFIKQKTIEYIQHLKVDSENPVEMGLVNELAVIDLYKNRAVMILSTGDRDGQGADFLRIDVSSIMDNGNGSENTSVATTTQVHPAMAVIDTLERRREKLLTHLLQTRKAASEIAIKMGKKKEDSALLDELRKVRELLAVGSQSTQVMIKEEAIPLKD